MQEKRIKHLVNWQDWTDSEILDLLEYSMYVKNNRVYFSGHMQNRTLVMLFQKTSTRTRVSFEAGMTEMGGHAVYLDWRTSNFQLTDIEFEAQYLSRNVSIIMARMKEHGDLQEIVAGSQVPVINGCCNLFHPCQSLADMLTIYQDRGSISGVNLCYIGVHNNVVNSLIEITSALGIHLVLVTPIGNDNPIIDPIIEKARKKGTITWETDPRKAVENCDYVYTDTWVDMEFFNDPAYQEEKQKRIDLMMPYQVNHKLLDGLNIKVMHDMPIHSEFEISKDMVKDPRSIIFQQAENRLDAQKAIILKLLH
ncbi:MAG: ornithine carbamoyltransferase [Leptospiraceae bacterium]|nr:ornithine carbamoyltransferase [Leptospiraceae bacterium]MCP5513072.1 ornithine carbamoyltransferase [Leptospiraceae bacterium]